VKRLRDALGDSADRPCYIETLPRRGYRFIAPIDQPGVGTDAAGVPKGTTQSRESSPDETTETDVGWRRARLLLALGVLAAIGAAWWAVGRRSGDSGALAPSPAPIRRELARLTFDRGLQTDVTWSPDGQRIAYASDQAGNFDIWLQAVRGGAPTPLAPSPAADGQPAWSPDGEQIVFRSDRDGGGLFVVSTHGGPARRLTSFGVRPIWWSAGRQILFRSGPESPSLNLYTVSASGDDQPRAILAEFLRGGAFEWIAPYPDGRLTLIGLHRTHQFGAFTLNAEGGQLTIVKPPSTLLHTLGWGDVHSPRPFHWSPTADALYVEVTSNGLPSLWRVRVAPVTLAWLSAEQLTTGAGTAASAAVSPDGRHLAFTSAKGVSRAWVFPFDPVRGRVGGEGQPVTAEEMTIAGLSLSPRGRAILYRGTQAGSDRVTVFTTDLETGLTTPLVHNALGAAPSRDGTQITYVLQRQPTDPQRSIDLEYAVGVRDPTGSERLVSRWSSRAAMMPTDWTPDGSALLGSYWEPLLTGPVALVLWPASGTVAVKPARVLLNAPGHRFWQATFSPDGRWISFVVQRPNEDRRLEMGVVAFGGAGPDGWTRIAADHEWPDKPRWAPDGRTLYFLSKKPAGYFNLWGVHMDPEHAKPVGEPFQITRFDSPAFMIDPEIAGSSEMDVGGRRLALTMRSVSGSLWMLSGVDK
jgi:Tol biopolymer transport system component